VLKVPVEIASEELMKNYLGATGFTERWQVQEALGALPAPQCMEQYGRLLMVGVLASPKTLAGKPAGHPNRYPAMCKLKHIFAEDPRTLNLIHYATPDRDEALVDQLKQMVELGGESLHGFQLNVAWPEVEALSKFRDHLCKQHRNLKIVLQCGPRVLVPGVCPAWLACEVASYGNLIDAVLIDPSGGGGTPYSVCEAQEYVRYLRKATRTSRLVVGIAGGLRHDNLDALLRPMLEYDPHLSFDAESGLRDDPQDANRDTLNMENLCCYLESAWRIITTTTPSLSF
jgi:hypothetical protein